MKQYQSFFSFESVRLRFTDGATVGNSQKAIQRKTGARGLRSILEEIMLEVMYEILPKKESRMPCYGRKHCQEEKPSSFTKSRQNRHERVKRNHIKRWRNGKYSQRCIALRIYFVLTWQSLSPSPFHDLSQFLIFNSRHSIFNEGASCAVRGLTLSLSALWFLIALTLRVWTGRFHFIRASFIIISCW